MSDYIHWLLLANGLYFPVTLLLIWHSSAADKEVLFIFALIFAVQGATWITIANLIAAGVVWP